MCVCVCPLCFVWQLRLWAGSEVLGFWVSTPICKGGVDLSGNLMMRGWPFGLILCMHTNIHIANRFPKYGPGPGREHLKLMKTTLIQC